MDWKNLKHMIAQMFKFGIVGLINTGITLGIIFVLMNLLGVYYVTANAVGYVAGFLNSFFMNRGWTFKSKGHIAADAVRFIAVFAVCYAIQAGLLILFKEKLNFSKEIATIAAMVIYTGLSFIGNKLFTFKSKEK